MTAYVESFEEELEKIAFNFAKMAPQGAGMLAGGALGLASTSKQGPGESTGGFATRALINTGLGAGMGFAGGKGVQALGFKNMKQIGKASRKGLRNMGILEKPKGTKRVKETLENVMEGLADNQKSIIGGLGLAGAATLLHGPTRTKILNAFDGISLDQINKFRQQSPQIFNDLVEGIKNGNLTSETVNKAKLALGGLGATLGKAWDDLVGGAVPPQGAGKMTGRDPKVRQKMQDEAMAQGGVTPNQQIDAQANAQTYIDDALNDVGQTRPPVGANATGPGTQSGARVNPVSQTAPTPSSVAGGSVPQGAPSAVPAGSSTGTVEQGFQREMQSLDDQLRAIEGQINTFNTPMPQNLTVQVPRGTPQAAPAQAASAAPVGTPTQVAGGPASQVPLPPGSRVQGQRPLSPQEQAAKEQARQAKANPAMAFDESAERTMTRELPPARVPGDEFDVNQVDDFLPTGEAVRNRPAVPARQGDEFDVSDLSDFLTTGEVTRVTPRSRVSGGVRRGPGQAASDQVFGGLSAEGRNSFNAEIRAINNRLEEGGQNSIRSTIQRLEKKEEESRRALRSASRGGTNAEIAQARANHQNNINTKKRYLEEVGNDVLQGDRRSGMVAATLNVRPMTRENKIQTIIEQLKRNASARGEQNKLDPKEIRRAAEEFLDSPRYKEMAMAIRGRERRLKGGIANVSSRNTKPRPRRRPNTQKPSGQAEDTAVLNRGQAEPTFNPESLPKRDAELSQVGTPIPRSTARPKAENVEERTTFTRIPKSETEPTQKVRRARQATDDEVRASRNPKFGSPEYVAALDRASLNAYTRTNRLGQTTRQNPNAAARRALKKLQRSDALDEAQKRALKPSNNPDRDRRRLYAFVTSRQNGNALSGSQLEKVGHQNKMKQLAQLVLSRRY